MIEEYDWFLKIDPFIENINKQIENNKGVRIGECTVVSKKMHIFFSRTPECVNVLQDFDAGKTFYHYKELGKVYHIDVFHQCGEVSHRKVANAIIYAVEVYNRHYKQVHSSEISSRICADYIDLQTATGGGRVTGGLRFGQKKTLQKAHINHVHIAMEIPSHHLRSIFYIIDAVESEIEQSGLELRCNEKIINISGIKNSMVDVSAYIDKTDSFLTKIQEDNNEIRLGESRNQKDAFDLMDNFNSVQELKEFLDRIELSKNTTPNPSKGVNSTRAVQRLKEKGIINIKKDAITLTQYGLDFKEYLDKYMADIQAYLKWVIQEAKTHKNPNPTGKGFYPQNIGICRSEKSVFSKENTSERCANLAIPETLVTAIKRKVEEKAEHLNVCWRDIKYCKNKEKEKIDFCFLIDASSSMEGRRIQAAKDIIRFLFWSITDRMGIVVFKENSAWLQVPFTRDYLEIEEGLREIQVSGETPLALGLHACMQYFDDVNSKKPFIVLITDGVPTLATLSKDPVQEATQMASEIKKKKYGFACIGLKPHLGYLKKIAQAAGGSVYTIEEFEQQMTVNNSFRSLEF